MKKSKVEQKECLIVISMVRMSDKMRTLVVADPWNVLNLQNNSIRTIRFLFNFRKRSLGKVIFSGASVILFTREGVCLQGGLPRGGGGIGQTPSPGIRKADGTHPT